MRDVLFICTGNYYRSRLAEALFNHGAESRGLSGWRAFSRGLVPYRVPGAGDLSPHTLCALRARGIALGYTATQPIELTEEDLGRAVIRVALKEQEHRTPMKARFKDWADRVEYWQVHDLDAGGPEDAIPQIEALVSSLLDRIEGEDVMAENTAAKS